MEDNAQGGDVRESMSEGQTELMYMVPGEKEDQEVLPPQAGIRPLLRSAPDKTALLQGLPTNLGKPPTGGGGKGKVKESVALPNPSGNGGGNGQDQDAGEFVRPKHPTNQSVKGQHTHGYSSESEVGPRGNALRGRPKDLYWYRSGGRSGSQRGRDHSRSDSNSRSRSPPRWGQQRDERTSTHQNCVARNDYEGLKRDYEALQKRSSLVQDEQRREIASLRKDVSFWKAKYNKSADSILCLGIGVKPTGAEQVHPFMDIFEVKPLTEEEQLVYTSLNIPLHMVVISTSLLSACCEGLPRGNEIKRTVNRVTNNINANVRLYTEGCDLEISATAALNVYLWSQLRGEAGSGKQFGTLKLAAWVVPDAYLRGYTFLAGNLFDVHMAGIGRFDFSKDDYAWEVECDVKIDEDMGLSNPKMPFSKKMYDMSSGNKTSFDYFLAGSQSEAGLGKGVTPQEGPLEWVYMEGEDGELVKVLNRPTHKSTKRRDNILSKFQELSFPSEEKDSPIIVTKTTPRVVHLGEDITWASRLGKKAEITETPFYSIVSPQSQGPKVKSNQGPIEKNPSLPSTGKNLKKGFYNQGNDTESFEDVCSTSKWSANGHLLNGLSVSYAGEKFDLATALSVAVCDGIPLVMPDAPLRAGHSESRGDKNVRVPASLTVKPWAASCNYAVLPDLIKGIAAEVIPDYRTGQNVNHQEGKVLFMTLVKLGFTKTSNSKESVGKQWLLDHNISASDPLAWNYAIAILVSRFNTEDNQARIIRNFQAGVQGEEALDTYFDNMLESAKGASTSMSFQQQANTIRSGMRDGTLVKAHLMGRAIPKLTSYEELVTLVKHTWLPEAVNYKEEGPKKKQGPLKQNETGSRNDSLRFTNQDRCSRTKCVGHDSRGNPHTSDVCWALHPEQVPDDIKNAQEQRKKFSAGSQPNGSASKQDTPTDAKGAGDSAKKPDSASKATGSSGGKGSGNTQKPSSN